MSNAATKKPSRRSRLGTLTNATPADLVLAAGIYVFVLIVTQYIGLFPPTIPRENAQNLLNVIIQVDGILLGFFGFVFATTLNGLQTQAQVATTELLRRLHTVSLVGSERFRKLLKTPGTAEYEYQRFLDETDSRRRGALAWMAVTSLFLIVSILWSFSRLASLQGDLSRSDLNWSIVPLFAGIGLFLLTVFRIRPIHLKPT